jgi:iron complex transport system substrate-binding protein
MMTVTKARPAPPSTRFLALAALLLLLLSACSTPESDTKGSSDAFRVVKTAKGDIEIPQRPVRIVTLGYENSVLLDLGIVPVGMAADAYDPTGVPVYNREPVEGEEVELIDTTAELPYEKIAGLRPDLILAGTYYEIDKVYDQLSEIAPTVTYVKGSYVDTWQEQATLIGEAVGKEAEAEVAIARVSDRISKIAADHPAWKGKTFSMSFNYDTGKITTIVNPKDFAIQLITQLGPTLSPKVATLAGGDLTTQPDVSYEAVEALDADVVLLAHASENLQTSLTQTPVFANLPSAKQNRVVTVDLVSINALRTPMLRGIDHALDLLVPEMERALGR